MQTDFIYNLTPLGDSAIMIELGNQINWKVHKQIKALAAYLNNHSITGMIEYIPAFTTLTVMYDPARVERNYGTSPYEIVCSQLEQILKQLNIQEEEAARVIKIPVCYGGAFGPDLGFVAKHNGLTNEEVISIHSNGEYLVYMIGFAPGFPYLGGMSETIATPRRDTPRLRIPAGSIGIAGSQTGVYPIATPGGWQLIGRSPIKFFSPSDDPPSFLQAGDIVQFVPISRDEFEGWEE